MMKNISPLSGQISGACDVYISGKFAARRRCWLNLDDEEFVVELWWQSGEGSLPKIEQEELQFLNMIILTQNGEMRATSVPVSFARVVGGGQSSIWDTKLGRALDAIYIAPKWRFICNDPIIIEAGYDAQEVLLAPGKKLYSTIHLACGSELIGTDYGISVRGNPDFDDAHQYALSLAMGGPLRCVATHTGNKIKLFLNNMNRIEGLRTFFDATNGGLVVNSKQADAIREVYRAALIFQKSQPDGGKAFRLAAQAFMEARSYQIGYTLKLLGVMQFLEWLDGDITLDHKNLSIHFNLPLGVAQAIVILRNEVSHNHSRKHIDLQSIVEAACKRLNDSGFDLKQEGFGEKEIGLLNFLFSLVGKLLLDRIGARVVPALYLPMDGRFSMGSCV